MIIGKRTMKRKLLIWKLRNRESEERMEEDDKRERKRSKKK